jgi:F-type H+-transporting ATPase subunit b
MPAVSFALALLAEEGHKGGLTDVHWNLALFTVILFILFAVVVGKLGWAPLLKAVEEREHGIRESVEGAQRSNAEAQALLAQHKEMLREAGREREEILKRALAEAETLKADLTTRARAESDTILQRAKDQIEREKTAAIQQLRSEVAELAMAAAAKIVQSSLTPEAQRKLVDEFIVNMPKAGAS